MVIAPVPEVILRVGMLSERTAQTNRGDLCIVIPGPRMLGIVVMKLIEPEKDFFPSNRYAQAFLVRINIVHLPITAVSLSVRALKPFEERPRLVVSACLSDHPACLQQDKKRIYIDNPGSDLNSLIRIMMFGQ